MINKNTEWFPCPVCLKPLDVRMTKRKKPYVICSPCGVQMFVRERSGIEAFGKLVEQGLKADVLTRIDQLEQRYRLKCPVCTKPFWVNPELAGTNWFNGKVTGYRCPENNCRGVVPIGEPSGTPTDPSPQEEVSKSAKDRQAELLSASELMSINSNSNAVHGARNPLPQSALGKTVSSDPTALETPTSRTSISTTAQRQRVEQMYRLANIFASIFETLPDEHVHAIATNREAA